MSTLATTNLKHASSGSNNIVLASDGTTTIASPSNIIKSGTAVTSTSGTAIDFTGIPSWVKRITVMLNGVSTNGSSIMQIQIGSGSIATSNYISSYCLINGGTGQGGSTSGIAIVSIPTAQSFSGLIVLSLISSNQWVASGSYQYTASVGAGGFVGGNTPALSGTLDRIRITTVNGTDTFDAGSINILYEG